MQLPSYLQLFQSGELARRVEQAMRRLRQCDLCPHSCGVNRLEGEVGFCATGAHPVVNDTMPHFGEESVLVGSGGSGAIFFSHCTMACIFCQTHDISQRGQGTEIDSSRLAELMLLLQSDGCHNINLITPTHVVPQILAAVQLAAAEGLHLPLVYNTSSYETLTTLELLADVVDIYLADFKFWHKSTARELCGVEDYPTVAREALKKMQQQVGNLHLDDKGLATSGLLVRHLVLPGYLRDTARVLDFIAREISVHTYVNLMGHYRPCGQAQHHPVLNRTLRASEYHAARQKALEVGLHRLDQTHVHLYEHFFSPDE
ncbi:MAG: radical SAM protein [Deltaproteobacteria bacterium]|nr:radical SAM protein [Deltaproteobacteria bacterium]MBW2071797.1 radical SAM protein [Deltaproteobacteria bacterium]